VDGQLIPLWKASRHWFPVTQHLVYMNHAAIAPLSSPAAEAMKQWVENALCYGSLHYDQWLAAYRGLRQAAAQLIGANSDEIAIVKNTSEGISTISLGLNLRPGDKVVAFREEFGANFFPWKRLESKAIHMEWLSIWDPPEAISEACRGARLLTISFVQYLSGYRADLETIGEICRLRGCLFFVDAIQGLGAFPVNVRKMGIHALAAGGHKWLLGPEGCGILYVQKEVQEQIVPAVLGWTNFAHAHDYASRDMTFRPDAGRYECGTLNTAGCFGLRAAIELLLKIGIDKIAAEVQARADEIAAAVSAKGYEVMCRRTPATGAGIVSFRKPGVDSRVIVAVLQKQGVITAARQGWVRASPHFYNSPEDVERMLAALP
jgi:selenocysteine lyase/cysteine desulfurase